jgi:hypothetical protein
MTDLPNEAIAQSIEALLGAVLDQHRLQTSTQCGAISIPVVHHHGPETDNRPGPKRSLACSEDVGHDGLHRDCICCYRFQTFEDWQVVDRKPRTFDGCSSPSCLGFWPCDTIKAIQEASA